MASRPEGEGSGEATSLDQLVAALYEQVVSHEGMGPRREFIQGRQASAWRAALYEQQVVSHLVTRGEFLRGLEASTWRTEASSRFAALYEQNLSHALGIESTFVVAGPVLISLLAAAFGGGPGFVIVAPGGLVNRGCVVGQQPRVLVSGFVTSESFSLATVLSETIERQGEKVTVPIYTTHIHRSPVRATRIREALSSTDYPLPLRVDEGDISEIKVRFEWIEPPRAEMLTILSDFSTDYGHEELHRFVERQLLSLDRQTPTVEHPRDRVDEGTLSYEAGSEQERLLRLMEPFIRAEVTEQDLLEESTSMEFSESPHG